MRKIGLNSCKETPLPPHGGDPCRPGLRGIGEAMTKNRRPRDRAALSCQKAAVSLGQPEILKRSSAGKPPNRSHLMPGFPPTLWGLPTRVDVRQEKVCSVHRVSWLGHPSSPSAQTPEDPAGHQDDCGLLSRLLQYHSCNLTVFFNPKELYKYMYIYSSVTECK